MFLRRKPKSRTPEPRRVDTSQRPAAFSYHANRSDQQYNLGRLQPRETEMRRREQFIRYWRQRIGLAIGIILILFSVVDVLYVASTPKIIPITQDSNDSILQPKDVYAAAAHHYLGSSILNGNKLTVDTNGLASQLRKQFPELADASVTLPLVGNRPLVYVTPVAVSVLLQSNHSGTFLVDARGVAIKAAAGTQPKDVPLVIDQTDTTIKAGGVAIPSDQVQFISNVYEELQLKGVPTAKLILAPAAYEIDVYPSGVGYYVKFNMHDSDQALEQVGAFLAVRKHLSTQGITPSSYIDVRLSGRAYYK